jgi:hypothetical protein
MIYFAVDVLCLKSTDSCWRSLEVLVILPPDSLLQANLAVCCIGCEALEQATSQTSSA